MTSSSSLLKKGHLLQISHGGLVITMLGGCPVEVSCALDSFSENDPIFMSFLLPWDKIKMRYFLGLKKVLRRPCILYDWIPPLVKRVAMQLVHEVSS